MNPPNSFLYNLVVPLLIGVWLVVSYMVFLNNPGILNPEPYMESLAKNRGIGGGRVENTIAQDEVFGRNTPRAGTAEAGPEAASGLSVPGRVTHRYTDKKDDAPFTAVPLKSADVEWALTDDEIISKEKNRIVVANAQGAILWQFMAPENGQFAKGTPLVANGAVYLATLSGRLYTFDLKKGRIIWYADTGLSILRAPIMTSQGIAVIAEQKMGQTWSLLIFDARSGEERHRFGGFELPLVGDILIQEPLFYFATLNGHLRAVDLETGETHWSAETSSSFRSGPAIVGERVYVANEDGLFLSFDRNSGRKTAEVEIGSTVQEPLQAVPGTSLAVTADVNGQLMAIDVKTAKRVWKHTLNHPGAKNYPVKLHRLETRSLNEMSFASSVGGWMAWAPCSGTRICIFDVKEGRLLTKVELNGKPLARFELAAHPLSLVVPVEKAGRFEMIRLFARAATSGAPQPAVDK